MNRLNTLIQQRTSARRNAARACASRVIEEAKGHGVDISVVGSLAKGRFRTHSDVDLLVRGKTDGAHRAMVEKLVADQLRGTELPYDLIFEADISPERVRDLLHDCI